jgi:hypothetical protein
VIFFFDVIMTMPMIGIVPLGLELRFSSKRKKKHSAMQVSIGQSASHKLMIRAKQEGKLSFWFSSLI